MEFVKDKARELNKIFKHLKLMKIVILCGGLGSRLSEETRLKPKPMVKIGNMPILMHIIKSYEKYGFNEFFLALGYKGYVIKKYFSKLKSKSDGILIKLPKRKQDLRMDLPTIGLNTLKDCKKYGLKGIVLKSKKNIFLDKEKCISFANKNKIFIKII